MDRSCSFAVIQFSSHPTRGEVLNVGLVVSVAEEAHVFCPRLDKIRAITNGIDPELMREDVIGLSSAVSDRLKHGASLVDAFIDASFFTNYKIGQTGTIRLQREADLEIHVQQLISQLVQPEPSPKINVRRKNTRLKSGIRNELKKIRILAKNNDRIDSNRVIANHLIGDISVDFFLKNGSYFLVETVDCFTDGSTRMRAMKDIAYSALIFEHARINLNGEVKPRLVYQASYETEKELSSSLMAAAHQGAELLNWQSHADRDLLLKELALHSSPLSSAKTTPINVHASTQRKFDIN